LAARALRELRTLCISHLVVDEAHCVGEWGDSFRPAYLQMGRVPKEAGIPLVTAFTATASARVLERVREVLFPGGTVNLVRANPDRPNITYAVVPSLCKEHTVGELLRTAGRPAIVFCRTRASTERTCRTLRTRLDNQEIRFYHAGLSKIERKRIEEWFFASSTGVLTATCAYGLGVDKSSIRTVIHRDTPPSVEAFLQESGRAGRDGKGAASYLVVGREDIEKPGRMADPTARQRYESLLGFARNSRKCRRESLLALLDAEPEFCFGCDVCDNQVIREPEGRRLLTKFVHHHMRRYTPREIVLILSGRKNFDVRLRHLDLSLSFGALGAWEPEDIETALSELERDGSLRVIRRGPWKHRVTLGRRRLDRRASL
jgi:ATP-dependent DNA helicase RecQ